MIIIAIDPGLKTGITRYDTVQATFHSDELDFDNTCRYLAAEATTLREELVLVSESFIIGPHTARNTQAPWSLELIGVARMLSRTWTGRDLHLQSPASAKRFSSDARLKMLGFHKPGKGHANDAARHLLLTLVTRGLLPEETVKTLAAVV